MKTIEQPSENYASILASLGFAAGDDELSNTVTAFIYEIGGTLFDEDSPFLIDKSEFYPQYDNLNSLVLSRLYVKENISTDSAVCYLMTIWYRWLRYAVPTLENIEMTPLDAGVRVRILTVSTSAECACSLEFILIPHEVTI